MKHQSEKPNIVVLGAGAVGCYFGGMLARAGHNVTLVARAEHVAAISEHGLHMDCQSFQEYVAVSASTDLAVVAQADLILLCVKSPDTTNYVALRGSVQAQTRRARNPSLASYRRKTAAGATLCKRTSQDMAKSQF